LAIFGIVTKSERGTLVPLGGWRLTMGFAASAFAGTGPMIAMALTREIQILAGDMCFCDGHSLVGLPSYPPKNHFPVQISG
jgi:hypothetical protein